MFYSAYLSLYYIIIHYNIYIALQYKHLHLTYLTDAFIQSSIRQSLKQLKIKGLAQGPTGGFQPTTFGWIHFFSTVAKPAWPHADHIKAYFLKISPINAEKWIEGRKTRKGDFSSPSFTVFMFWGFGFFSNSEKVS